MKTDSFLFLTLVGWAVAVALSVHPIHAGDLRVSATAAYSGVSCGGWGCGVEADLDGCATTSDATVKDRTLSADETVEACRSLHLEQAQVADGADVRLFAGERVTFGDGFSVISGGHLTAGVVPDLLADTALVEENPAGEVSYVARYFLNLDEAVLEDGDQFTQFVGRDRSGNDLFRVRVKRDSGTGEMRLFADVRQDDGSYLSTENGHELVFPDGWHAVEVDWSAARETEDGRMVLCIDDTGSRTRCERIPSSPSSTLQNSGHRLRSILWGALGVDATTAGTLSMDDFESYRYGPIGGPSTATNSSPFARAYEHCTMSVDSCQCYLDAACVPSPFFRLYQRGVAVLAFNGQPACTAFLVNDGSPYDPSDLVLTAEHCVGTRADADAAELYWDYVSPSCGATPPSLQDLPQSVDLGLLHSWPEMDIAILEVRDLPPNRFFFGVGGWPEQMFSLHHAKGKPQHFSSLVRRSVLNQCYGEEVACLEGVQCDGFSYLTGRVQDGTMDHGSSGAPLFGEDGSILGLHSGRCSNSCEVPFGPTVLKIAALIEALPDYDMPNTPPYTSGEIIFRDSFEDGTLTGWGVYP